MLPTQAKGMMNLLNGDEPRATNEHVDEVDGGQELEVGQEDERWHP